MQLQRNQQHGRQEEEEEVQEQEEGEEAPSSQALPRWQQPQQEEPKAPLRKRDGRVEVARLKSEFWHESFCFY